MIVRHYLRPLISHGEAAISASTLERQTDVNYMLKPQINEAGNPNLMCIKFIYQPLVSILYHQD